MGELLKVRRSEGTSGAGKLGIALAVSLAGLIGAAAAAANGRTAALTPGSAAAANFAERFNAHPADPDCAAGGWPYLSSHCLHRTDGSRPRPVRVIAIDRQVSIR